MGEGRLLCLGFVLVFNIVLPIISTIFVPDVDPAYPKMDIVAHSRWIMGILLGAGLIGSLFLGKDANTLGRRIGLTILVLVSLGYLACGIAAVRIQTDYCATRPVKLGDSCAFNHVMGALLIVLGIFWGLQTLIRWVSVRDEIAHDEEKAKLEEANTQAAPAAQTPAGRGSPPPYDPASGEEGTQEKVPDYEGGDDVTRSSMDKTAFGGVAIDELPRAYHPDRRFD